MKKIYPVLFFIFVSILFFPSHIFAGNDSVKVKVTVLKASNEGSDFDFDNDAYRDQLVKLFSYKSYHQLDVKGVELKKADRSIISLPEGYELVLTYQGSEGSRIMVQALVRKNTTQYVYTVLSIQNPGVVFVGGPEVEKGVLVIVLETGS